MIQANQLLLVTRKPRGVIPSSQKSNVWIALGLIDIGFAMRR